MGRSHEEVITFAVGILRSGSGSPASTTEDDLKMGNAWGQSFKRNMRLGGTMTANAVTSNSILKVMGRKSSHMIVHQATPN